MPRYLRGSLLHQLFANFPRIAAVRTKHCTVADNVDDSRDAAGQIENFLLCRIIEDLAQRARNLQPMIDVLSRLFTRQGFEVISAGYSLSELAEVVARQNIAQLRLGDQDDLQKFLFGGFEVCQQTKLFENVP